jgi:mono/diheme cytochrome c family protein
VNEESSPKPKTAAELAAEDNFTKADLGEGMNVAMVHDSILREQADPRDGFEPIPLWLVTIIMAIVFWAGLYLAYNSGGFQSDVYDPSLVSWTGGGAAAETGPPDPMVVGRRVFTQNCVVCHQANGQGVPGQFPPLADSEWVLSTGWHGDNHLVKVILHGLQGVVEVRGNIYNNAMPAQNLNDAQISAVLTYIRNEWGNSAPAISEDFVAVIREQSPGRTEPWTQNELQAIERVLDSGAPPATEEEPAAEDETSEAETPDPETV